MFSLKNESGRVTLSCEKQKDGVELAPILLQLKPVGASCALIGLKTAWDLTTESLTRNHYDALRSLSRDFLSDGATCADWRDASKVSRAGFFRVRSDLVTWGYVTVDKQGRGARYTVTDKGRKAIGIRSHEGLKKVSETDSALGLSHPPPLGAVDCETETDLRLV